MSSLCPVAAIAEGLAGPPAHFVRMASQALVWVDPGQAPILFCTIVEERGRGWCSLNHFPAIVKFDGAAASKIASTIVDAQIEDIKIGVSVSVGWQWARNPRFL